MFYCEKCHHLSNEMNCSDCGFNNLREVKDDDFCFLAIVDEYLGKMLIDTMENNDIQCVVEPVGNGVRSYFALTLGNYRLYVAYKQYNRAVEIIEFYTQNNSTNKLRAKILENIDLWHFENDKVEKKIRRKLKISQDVDLMQIIEEKVKKAQSINDVGLMTNNEHGLIVRNDSLVLWFSSESFEINI